MKGQMFLIAGIIMITILVGMKTNLSLANILENERHLASQFDSLEFSNIRSEMIRSLQLGFNSTLNMTSNLNNFNSFVRSSLSSKSVEFDSLLIETYYTNLTANVNSSLYVTINNNLGTDISSMNLTFNGTTTNVFAANGNLVQTTLTFNTSASANQTLTVTYITSKAQTEYITIPLNVAKSEYITFFDIRYISNIGQQSDKFTSTISLV